MEEAYGVLTPPETNGVWYTIGPKTCNANLFKTTWVAYWEFVSWVLSSFLLSSIFFSSIYISLSGTDVLGTRKGQRCYSPAVLPLTNETKLWSSVKFGFGLLS